MHGLYGHHFHSAGYDHSIILALTLFESVNCILYEGRISIYLYIYLHIYIYIYIHRFKNKASGKYGIPRTGTYYWSTHHYINIPVVAIFRNKASAFNSVIALCTMYAGSITMTGENNCDVVCRVMRSCYEFMDKHPYSVTIDPPCSKKRGSN